MLCKFGLFQRIPNFLFYEVFFLNSISQQGIKMQKKYVRGLVVAIALSCLATPAFAMSYKLYYGPKVGSNSTNTKVLETYKNYEACEEARKAYIGGIPDGWKVWCG